MKGYEQLSLLTSEFPELLMLRRFDKLSSRILLRLQAELLYLEQELEVFIDEDAKEDHELSTRWGKIREAGNQDHVVMHLDKCLEVEKKLKTYHETILRLYDIRRMSRPTPQNKARLREWLCSPEGGGHFLESIEAGPWESEKIDELLAFTPKFDRLDNWLSDVITPVYHRVFGHKLKPDLDADHKLGRLWTYNIVRLQYVGDFICVLLSSVVPVASIQGLYWIPTTLGRLLMITGFVILFSFLLMFVVGCRRSEVFAATSAYAAVLVVFLQGLNGVVNGAG